MTGLEKILAAISEQAQSEADEAVFAARAQAEAVLGEAREKSRARREEIEADGKAQAERLLRAAASSTELNKRKRMLALKQDLLEKTFEDALLSLLDLPEGEYFALLIRMAAQNAEQGEGEMLLGARDRARLAPDFEAKLADALPAGAVLRVPDETRPIEGGFILRYGKIEQNCSFRAVFDARREELYDLAGGILFA